MPFLDYQVSNFIADDREKSLKFLPVWNCFVQF